MFPTILALFWRRLPARGAFWAVALSLGLGTPLSIYANIREDPHLIVLAAGASAAIGLVVCLATGFLNREPSFEFAPLDTEDAAHAATLGET